MVNYHTINLGYFDTFEEAVLARLTKEKEVCGEYDGPRECYSKWVKTSIRPLIDAVKENYNLCARLIIKEYCDVLLLD